MGELISSNEGTRQKDVFKQNLAKPNCIKPGSKKRFVLVDDDDTSDDEVFQDVNEIDIEQTYLEDVGDEGYIVRSQGHQVAYVMLILLACYHFLLLYGAIKSLKRSIKRVTSEA